MAALHDWHAVVLVAAAMSGLAMAGASIDRALSNGFYAVGPKIPKGSVRKLLILQTDPLAADAFQVDDLRRIHRACIAPVSNHPA